VATQFRSDQLAAHLERELRPLYVIHGTEPLLSLEAADLIRVKARANGCAERDVFVVERGFDWSRLMHSAAGMSLFSDRKLIELRIATGKPDAAGAQALEAYCADLVAENVTIVSLPRLAKRDQGSAWFTALGQAGVLVNVYEVVRSDLPAWLSRRLARQQQSAAGEALGFLADAVEGNLLAAHQEIQKLGLLYPAGTLDFDQIRAAVMNVARHDVYQLVEAMLAGDPVRAARVTESLRGEGEQAPRVLWFLAEELRSLARIQQGSASGRAVSDLLRENRVWGEPRSSLMTRAVRQVKPPAVHAALVTAARVDRISKGIGKGDVWDELLQLALRLAER
jgi:DNA polymerase III subunit delta